MSQYLNVFIRCGEQFLPIGIYCRSSVVYGALDGFAPYEKITPITKSKLVSAKNNIREDMEFEKAEIEKLNETKKLICTYNNSVEEKTSAIMDIDRDIADINNCMLEKQEAISYLSTLMDILEAAHDYALEPSENDNVPATDPNNYLYAGIEIGDPGINDIV